MYKKSVLYDTYDNLNAIRKNSALTDVEKYSNYGYYLANYVSTLMNYSSPSASVKTKIN